MPHWVLDDQSIDARVTVPDDLAVTDIFEIVDAKVQALSFPKIVSGREVRFPAVPLSNTTPVRLVVLARSPSLRAQIAAGLTPP